MLLKVARLLIPEAGIEGDPFLRRFERLGLQPHNAKAAAPFPSNKFSVFKYLDVLGDRREGHLVRSGNFTDRSFARREFTQDLAAGGIGQRMKDGIELSSRRLNHMV